MAMLIDKVFRKSTNGGADRSTVGRGEFISGICVCSHEGTAQLLHARKARSNPSTTR